MPSEVDICNASLALIGESATVTSIDPPEGSAHARHCARFYPMVRDSLLQMYTWSFATRRSTPALIESTITEWAYSYALPSNTLKVFSVLPDEPIDTYGNTWQPTDVYDSLTGYTPTQGLATLNRPIPFETETISDGTVIVYTNQEDAKVRYVVRVTDTNKFSPLFNDALSHLLASRLAGPVIKGKAGAAESKEQLKLFFVAFGEATKADARQRSIRPAYTPSGVRAR